MEPSSRTPEGEANRCPVCGAEVCLEPSRPAGDAPCPHCGCLMWFGQVSGTPLGRREVEAARQAIRGWVSHFATLSHSTVRPMEYCRELVDGVVRSLAARGGIIWLLDHRGLNVQYHVGLDAVGVPEMRLCEPWHLRLVQTVMEGGCPSSRPPQWKSRLAQEGANLTDFLVLLSPIKHGGTSRAIVEVFQRNGAGPATQRGYLRFLQQICEIAGKSHFFCSM